jgi:hypothetical protein
MVVPLAPLRSYAHALICLCAHVRENGKEEQLAKDVPVSLRAVIGRINRKLKPEYLQLKVTRGARARQEFGDFYVLNVYENRIMQNMLWDPEALGRELGVLAEWESVEK